MDNTLIGFIGVLSQPVDVMRYNVDMENMALAQ